MLQSLLRRVPVRLLVLVGLSLSLLFYQNDSTTYLPHFDDTDRISRYFNTAIGQSKWSPISLDRLSSLASGDTPAEFPPNPMCPNTTTTTVAVQMSCPTEASPNLPLQVPRKQAAPTDPALSAEQRIMNNMRDGGIVIVFKTGAQEVSQLAIHIGTTLRFFDQQDILFFSDLHDTLGPFTVHDALRNVNQSIREYHPEFEIYRNLQKYHSTGQDIQKLVEGHDKGNNRPGWILDKWKFLHMVEETFEMRPNAKWYIFMETDSCIVWPNLVAFLRRHDHTKPLYMGSAVNIGSHTFAHGGSGYALSNAVMNKLLGPAQPQGLAASWDGRIREHCCGDLALGIALQEKGVELTVAHPWFNGYKPTTLTYGPKNHWCQPVVTMHHVTPADVSDIWRFERQREMIVGTENLTLFADLFHHFVEPHIALGKENWDNLSHGPTYSRQTEVAKQQAIDEQKKKEEEKMKKDKEQKNAEDGKKPQDEKNEKAEGKKDGSNQQSNELSPLEATKDDQTETKPPEDKTSATKQTPENQRSPSPSNHKQESELEAEAAKDDLDDTAAKLFHARSSKPKLVKRQDSPLQQPLTTLERAAHLSFALCGKACTANPSCFQYLYYDETCKLGLSFRLGQYQEPAEWGVRTVKSGWLVERIREWSESDGNRCEEGPRWEWY